MRASLRRLLSAETDTSPSTGISKLVPRVWEMTARKMFLKFVIFGVVFMPFLTQAEANIAGMYGF